MKRRDLLKLFAISPIGVLFSLRNPYKFLGVSQEGSGPSRELQREVHTIWTANPQYYRNRLPDLWSEHRSLVEVMADHCMATARSRDTRGWTLKQWNEELDEPKWQWQLEDMRRTHEKKRSA